MPFNSLSPLYSSPFSFGFLTFQSELPPFSLEQIHSTMLSPWILPFLVSLITIVEGQTNSGTATTSATARMAESACSISKISSSPTTPLASTPSCSLQNPDPDQGILGQGCVCGSITLPPLTISSATDESQCCAY